MNEQPKQDKPKTISWAEALRQVNETTARLKQEEDDEKAAARKAAIADDFDFSPYYYAHFNANQLRALVEYVGGQVSNAEREVERLNHLRIELDAMATELDDFEGSDE